MYDVYTIFKRICGVLLDFKWEDLPNDILSYMVRINGSGWHCICFLFVFSGMPAVVCLLGHQGHSLRGPAGEGGPCKEAHVARSVLRYFLGIVHHYLLGTFSCVVARTAFVVRGGENVRLCCVQKQGTVVKKFHGVTWLIYIIILAWSKLRLDPATLWRLL